jgi:ribosomal protein L2
LAPRSPVEFETAVAAGRSAKERMAEAKPQRTNSESKVGNKNAAKDKEGNDADNISVVTKGHGTSADYLAARIKRDHPTIAEAVERGEYRSIRQAALAASRFLSWFWKICRARSGLGDFVRE